MIGWKDKTNHTTAKHIIAAIRAITTNTRSPFDMLNPAEDVSERETLIQYPSSKRAVIACEGTNCPVARFATREGMLVEEWHDSCCQMQTAGHDASGQSGAGARP
jgi:hypothetical protein